MSRLIDADALIDNTKNFRCIDCERRKGMKNGKLKFVYEIGDAPCRACDVADMIDTIDEAPTVDAAPVVHARWEKINNPSYSPFDGSSEHLSVCSNCTYSRDQHDFLYCPNCGAKMDLEGR